MGGGRDMPQLVDARKPEEALMVRLTRHRELSRLLKRGSPEGVRMFVEEVSDFFGALGVEAGLDPDQRPVIAGAIIQDAFSSLVCYCRGHHAAASRLLVARWRAYLGKRSPAAFALHCRPTKEDDQLLSVFSAVVAGTLVTQAKTSRAAAVLTRLASALALSYDDLGRMLGVAGETARRWAGGASEIPEDQMAKLDTADAALTKLQHLFRPSRLPEVIRRPAALFDGEVALEWIRRGRIVDVAERYDRALSYQG